MPPIELRRADLAEDLRLEYAERGSGPAIVLLHGYSDSWYSFDQIMRRLGHHRRQSGRARPRGGHPGAS